MGAEEKVGPRVKQRNVKGSTRREGSKRGNRGHERTEYAVLAEKRRTTSRRVGRGSDLYRHNYDKGNFCSLSAMGKKTKRVRGGRNTWWGGRLNLFGSDT